MNNLILFKQCTKCLEEKLSSEFRKQSITKDGLKKVCKTCDDKYAKEHYKNNSEKIKQQVKNYNHSHKKEINLWRSNYHKNHPITRIRKQLMNVFRKHVPLSCSNSFVGCSNEELKIHIEKQWQKDMTWENYGKIWYLIKIKQFSEFNITNLEEVKLINHYSNLKPIYIKENNEKMKK